MHARVMDVFWAWSRWWSWRRRLAIGEGALAAAGRRLRRRPEGTVHASGGGNPSLLAARRMPCALRAPHRRQVRKRRPSPQISGA